MRDAPIAFEMAAETNDIFCIKRLTRRSDKTKRRKPKIIGGSDASQVRSNEAENEIYVIFWVMSQGANFCKPW